MSGVEITGFVLAAIPLMISALEHYRDTEEVLEGWWKVKCEYKKCMRNLKYHKLAFEENLEELLLPLIADEEKLQRLLETPGGPEWQDPRLEELLQQRMPKTYSSYLDTMESMKETIEGLEAALGTGKTHFQSRVSVVGQYQTEKMSIVSHVTSNIEYHSQRIRLAFNKDVRKQLFDDFGDQNSRLRDILGSSDRLASLRRARVTTSVNSGLWKFWNHGNVLFNLLTEAWSCKCQAFHHASLLLQHRVVPTVNFRVVFWFKRHLAGASSGQLPWAWQDTSIKLLEEPTGPIMMKVPIPASIKVPVPVIKDILTPSKMPQQNIPSPKYPAKAPKKSLRDRFRHSRSPSSPNIVKPTDTPSSTAPTSTSSPTPNGASQKPREAIADPDEITNASSLPTPTSSPKPRVAFADHAPPETSQLETPKITNLCSTIAHCSPNLPKDYGYLKGDSRQYLVQPLCTANKEPQKYVTLEALLSKSSPVTLTRRLRFQIALILASSHVQLHPTPWLKSKWSKKDVLFLYDVQDPTRIGTDQPYISRSLSKVLQQPSNETGACDNTYSFQDSIRNLGIMLLELCFGTAIEEHRLRRIMNVSGNDEQTLQLINYAVAIQWARDVVEEAGPEISDAIYWCLHHTPESGEGKDEKWREDMFVKVVEPLKGCHDQLMSIGGKNASLA